MRTRNVGIRWSKSVAKATLVALTLTLSATLLSAQEPAGGRVITFVRLANGEPGGEGIYEVNADGTDEQLLFRFDELGLPYDVSDGGYRCPVWSPDGTRLALNGSESGSNYIAIVNVDDASVQRVYEVHHDDQTLRNVYFPEWVPGEDRLSFGYIEAERDTGLILASGIRVVALDGSYTATVRDDLQAAEDGTPPQYLGGPVSNYTPFAHSWSPDGSRLAVAAYNWRTYIMDGDGLHLRTVPAQWANGDVEWSPNGSALATSLYRLTLVDPIDFSERELVPIGETLNGSTVESLAWSPDGREIAYTTMWMEISGGNLTTAFSVSVVDVESGEIRELVRTPSFSAGEYPFNISCVDWRPSNGS